MPRLSMWIRSWFSAFVVGAAFVETSFAGAQPSEVDPGEARIAAWREDLAFMARELPQRHVNPFTRTSAEDFAAAVADLHERLPAMGEHEVAVAYMQITALLGDSHTSVDTSAALQGDYPYVPLNLSDGYFIAAAEKDRAEWVGARIEAVGGVPIAEAAERLASVRACENRALRSTVPADYLNSAPVLHALGLASEPDRVTLTLRLENGAATDVEFTALPADAAPEWIVKPAADDPRRPLSRRGRSEWYWFGPIGNDAIYCKYDRCAEQPGRPFADFAAELRAAIEARPGCRVIVDLRRNGGGDSSVLAPVVRDLKRRSAGGALIALIGPRTFSSGMMNALQLQEIGGILMGEATGQAPNAFGEIRSFELPNMKWSVWYSTKRFDMLPGSSDESLMPDVTVEMDSKAWFNAADPVLEAALGYEAEPVR